MSVTICKTFTFDAAHFLPAVPDGHKCKRMHGHTYRVELRCEGEIDKQLGWLVDYGDLATLWKEFFEPILDHRVLNEVDGLENPTTENLVAWMAMRLWRMRHHAAARCVTAVRIYESSTTWCEIDVVAP